jgi:hypothetical protein
LQIIDAVDLVAAGRVAAAPAKTRNEGAAAARGGASRRVRHGM